MIIEMDEMIYIVDSVTKFDIANEKKFTIIMFRQKLFLLSFFMIVVVAIGVIGGPPQKIVGGQIAGQNEFPFLVSLRKNSGFHFCGGAIISKRHILTAAHCMRTVIPPYTDKFIVSGTTDRLEGGEKHRIKTVAIHPGYVRMNTSFPHDVAVITLQREMLFNKNQNLIKLATQPPRNGSRAIVAGWGFTKEGAHGSAPRKLMKLNTTVLDTGICRKRLSGRYEVLDSQVCDIPPKGKDTCHGDSGGPMVSGGKVVGIVSFGVGCARNFPSVSASVAHHKDFILEQVHKIFPKMKLW